MLHTDTQYGRVDPIIIPISLESKGRLRKVKRLMQDHRAGEGFEM